MELATPVREPERRVHRSEAQWRALVARQAASGLGVTAFCQQEAVSLSSFRRWRTRVMGNDGLGGPPPGFVDLGALGATVPRGGALELTLELGGGVVLRLVRG